MLARTFVAGVDTANIRNDLSAYLKAANAVKLEEELGDGESGTTITKPNGTHVITVNTREPEVRKRYTLCHEIAHIILKLPSSHAAVPAWAFAKRDLNEIHCDTFAAELLMPYKQWREKLPKEEPSAAVIDYMAGEFNCSFPAAASRYATLADMPCAYVTMEHGAIKYAARSRALRDLKAWIPPRSTIPDGSVASRIRADGNSQIATGSVDQDIWFQDWDKGMDMMELARHYHSSDTTLSLLWFDADDGPIVEVDRFGVKLIDEGGLKELTGELPWPGRSKRR